MTITYKQSLYAQTGEEYNLPVDTVYYIESEWDYKTNEYFQQHHKELEDILNENPEHLLKYRLCYIPRETTDSRVRALFPLTAIHTEKKAFCLFPKFARERFYKKKLHTKVTEGGSYNYPFKFSLLTHLIPNQHGEEEHLGMFTFDIEGIECADIPDTLRVYIAKIEEYNHTALTTGVEYQPKWDDKIRFCIETRESDEDEPEASIEIMPKVSAKPFMEEKAVDSDVQFSIVAKKDIRPKGDIRYSLSIEEPQVSEYERLRALAEKIKAGIDELQRQNGINILIEILSKEHKSLLKLPPIASHMTIDDKFRIWLDDYNHMEIKMPTLCKAVYFLFLKHPEGIYLKDMWDYHDELREIYMTISLRTNLDQMERSIMDLVDSTSDSLQQKLSKIAAAFRADLATDFAKLYTINGKRGEAYSIDLESSDINLSQELKDLFARLQK